MAVEIGARLQCNSLHNPTVYAYVAVTHLVRREMAALVPMDLHVAVVDGCKRRDASRPKAKRLSEIRFPHPI
jgi:hypothetical protein